MDQSVTRPGIFSRIEPDLVAAVTERLLPADFLAGQTIFAEGEPGDRLLAPCYRARNSMDVTEARDAVRFAAPTSVSRRGRSPSVDRRGRGWIAM